MNYLIDTCIISDLYEDQNAVEAILANQASNKISFVISISTIHELQKVKNRYNWLKEFLNLFTFYLIKPANMLMKEELENYRATGASQPFILNLSENQGFLDHLENSKLFSKGNSRLWEAKGEVLDSIIGLKSNFKPDKNGKYSNESIEGFLQTVSAQQLTKFFPESSTNFITDGRVDTRQLKSLRSQLLITLWKFYVMKDRKARKSDVFDITIASGFPYVDVVLTEKNMANDIRQIQRRGLFFDRLKAFSLNEWMKSMIDTTR